MFAARSVHAQIDLTNVEATGFEQVKISVKGGPTISTQGEIVFDVDGAGMAVLDSDGIDIEGDVDDSAKKPLWTITNWSQIEGDLETMIETADPSFIPASVTIDQAKAKATLAAKLKGDLGLKLGLSFPFMVNESFAGKFALKAVALEARPPDCEGNSYTGIESFSGSVQGVGGVKSKNQVATLTLGAESVPFDQMIDFTYENLSSTPNTQFSGSLDFTDKKPSVVMDANSRTDLEENLEALILDEAGVVANVTLLAEKTSFQCGKNGESAQFAYSAVFLADFGVQGTRPGKVSISSKMTRIGGGM
jgi:hypothetical protein